LSASQDGSDKNRSSMPRRRFLQLGGIAAAGCLLPGLVRAAQPRLTPAERALSFYNIHTGESCQGVYWARGRYEPAALKAINRILRDHRTGQIKAIDPKLLDLLHRLTGRLGCKQPMFNIISGYRSPETNAMLRREGHGVARNSFHLAGRAVDIELPGCDLGTLHRVALALQGGGVGYYPESGFVHLDTGPVREW
jgi:uncharacterized protein YcbK (DUF882 family)